MIKFVSDLRQVCGFPTGTPPIKLTATIQLKYSVKHHQWIFKLRPSYFWNMKETKTIEIFV